MVTLALLIFGLAFGSFINALVWRIYKQSKSSKRSKKYSITTGRSMCVHCSHELGAKDLVPVLSWLSLKGRCRYCNKPISWQYPAVEALTAVLFAGSYIFWPFGFEFLGVILFIVWLAILIGLIALAVYDIKWQLLPNRIVFFLYYLGGLYVILRFVQDMSYAIVAEAVLSTLIGGGIFWILFHLSDGKWIGGGDVKLGFLLGAIVFEPQYALMVIFIASLLGTLYSLPQMVSGKLAKQSRIPFGPFLIVATVIVLFFGADLSDAYAELLLVG